MKAPFICMGMLLLSGLGGCSSDTQEAVQTSATQEAEAQQLKANSMEAEMEGDVQDFEAIARLYAEQSETYLQDGHNLRLREPQLNKCDTCYDFAFDHYGDPGVEYVITVRVEKGGIPTFVD